jgi:flagellar biosynthetic protein FliS
MEDNRMSAHQGYANYSSNSARYASAGIQVAMLLAKAARHMEDARDRMVAGDIEGRFNATEKCATILSGLRGCLNRDSAEAVKVSDVLDAYYARMLSYLTQINIKNDQPLCESVIDSLRTMSSTWREIQAKADAEATATSTAQARPLGGLGNLVAPAPVAAKSSDGADTTASGRQQFTA